MRFLFRLILIFFTFYSQSSRAFDKTKETRYVKLHWSDSETSVKEASKLANRIDSICERIGSLLNVALNDKNKLNITLNGDGIRPHKQMRTPYTDTNEGWIHLYRFPNADYAYQNGLSHELVHAIRFNHLKKHITERNTGFGFLEEGLAEYISSLVEPNKPGFSNFGVSLTVAAAQLIAMGKVIPLHKLLNQFADLDQKCMAQSYVLRASFLEYLDQEYGHEALLKIAFQEAAVTEQSFKQNFGREFSILEQEWLKWLNKKANSISSFRKLSSKYQAALEKRQMYLCAAGNDY